MFKIVQTIERGKPQLCIVPSSWENAGTLYWPKAKADKLITDPKSVPEDNWFQMTCSLKRHNLKNLDEANHEINKMLEKDDTDVDDCPATSSNKRKVRVLLPKKHRNINDFNHLVETCLQATELDQPAELNQPTELNQTLCSVITPQPAPAPPIIQFEPAFIQQQCTDDNIDLNTVPLFPVDNISEKMEEILKNQKEILKNQKMILNQVIGFTVLIEDVLKTQNLNSNKEKTSSLRESKKFTIINSIEDMETLEQKLRDEETVNELIEKFSVICGRGGKEYGLNVCYTLVDKMFTRNFMTLCSWAGGSRNNANKIAFKNYKKVINLFFELVHLADNDFTLEKCETFFKNILKNSTRRNEHKNSVRISRAKRRPSNLTYNSKKCTIRENQEKSDRNIIENSVSESDITDPETENDIQGDSAD